jgi:replicative DNA helicase
VERSKALNFFATDKSGLNILQVRSKARTIKRKRGLDVLIVDYIGLMSGLNPRDPRAYQIEEISRGLKALAKELDIVVICLAQVNRGAMDRANSTPGLHDLRDSGAIEQDADVVMFIHRPIVSNPQAGDAYIPYALLRVAKNRQGRTGDIHCHYHGEFTRFDSWAGEIPSSNTKQQPIKRGFGHEDSF